jgi:hypothetical protein
VAPLLAAFPSSPTGLSPGAGNEAEKAEEADADLSNEVEKGKIADRKELALANGDAPAVRRHHDGDELTALVRMVHDASSGSGRVGRV